MSTRTSTPNKAVSTHRIEQTPEERAEFNKQWRKDRENKEKLKNERFAAIRERRKNNKPGVSRDSGGGINIEVNG